MGKTIHNKRNEGNHLKKDFPLFRERLIALEKERLGLNPEESINVTKAAEFLEIARKTYHQYVNGEYDGKTGQIRYKTPSMDYLIRIADKYNVSIDYLTGRIDRETHSNQYICNETGLSEKAVKKIKRWKLINPEWINHISAMLLKPEMKDILHYMDGLLSFGNVKRTMNNIIEKNPIESLKNQDAQTIDELLTVIKSAQKTLENEALQAEILVSRIGTKAETIAEDIYNSNR